MTQYNVEFADEPGLKEKLTRLLIKEKVDFTSVVYLLKELWPWFEIDESPFIVHVIESRYASWTGGSRFLDLVEHTSLQQLPSPPAMSVAINLDEVIRRCEAPEDTDAEVHDRAVSNVASN